MLTGLAPGSERVRRTSRPTSPITRSWPSTEFTWLSLRLIQSIKCKSNHIQMGSDITQVDRIFYLKSDNDQTHWKVFANKEAICGPAALKKAPEKCIFLYTGYSWLHKQLTRFTWNKSKNFQYLHSSNSSKASQYLQYLQYLQCSQYTHIHLIFQKSAKHLLSVWPKVEEMQNRRPRGKNLPSVSIFWPVRKCYVSLKSAPQSSQELWAANTIFASSTFTVHCHQFACLQIHKLGLNFSSLVRL